LDKESGGRRKNRRYQEMQKNQGKWNWCFGGWAGTANLRKRKRRDMAKGKKNGKVETAQNYEPGNGFQIAGPPLVKTGKRGTSRGESDTREHLSTKGTSRERRISTKYLMIKLYLSTMVSRGGGGGASMSIGEEMGY